MGRHREELNKRILQKIGNDKAPIDWLDFKFDRKKPWYDAELKGLEFLRNIEWTTVKYEWTRFWPQPRGNRGIMNWDTVARIGSEGKEYLLVEAKANIEEMNKPSSEKRRAEKIRVAFEKTKKWLKVPQENNWLPDNYDKVCTYYQTANRLTVLYFLNTNGIAARLLFIYFCGDKASAYKWKVTCPKNKEEWNEVLKQQEQYLGLPKNHRLIHRLFLPVVEGAQEQGG
jgi:hypothetical protein